MSWKDGRPVPQIAIVGVGQVGAAAAYALTLRSIPAELLLVDVQVDLRNSHVRDLADAAYSCNSCTRVRAVSHHEAGQSDIVVITAGSRYSVGSTSVLHMYENVATLRNTIQAMRPFGPHTVLLVVANPVDLLTSLAQQLSGLPASQVLGSGTFLDSVRLRGMVAARTKISASSIDLYVLGVQGDSQIVAWSTAGVGGVPLEKSLPPGSLDRDEMARKCKEEARRLIEAKGSTPFGIGSVISSICSSILFDKRTVRPISHWQPEFGCSFSLPVVLGRNGIERTLQVPLSNDETAALIESAKELSMTLKRVNDDQFTC